MKQEDKLKDTLREYYDTREIPFKDEDWDRAGAYLSSARRGRRMRYAALILIILFPTLFITLFYFPKSSIGTRQPASSLSERKSDASPALQSEVLRTPMVPEQTKETRVNSDTRSRHTVSTAGPAPVSLKDIPETQTNLSFVNTTPAFESVRAEQELPLAKEENENKVNEANDNPPLATPTALVNTNNTQKDILPELPGDPEENAETIPVEIENPAESPDQSGEAVALQNNKQETAIPDTTKFSDRVEKEITNFADTSGHKPVASASVTAEIPAGDTLPDPSSLNLVGEGIFYEAGAAWHYGWKGPVNKDARGFSPVAGINYMNRISNRSSISFGVQYLQVRNLSNSSKTSRVSSYIYGEQTKVTTITPSTLHYLVAPLRFHYYLNKENCFGGGVNLAYLLNVDAKVTSYDEKPGFKENHETARLSGYTQGFSWFDSQLALFYRRRISSSLALQAEIFIGLTDVKQDSFFNFKNKERNSGAKLSLIYFAFRKNYKQ